MNLCISRLFAFLLSAISLLAPEAADATVVLYQTGFETPEYQLGNLVGQNGWSASGGLSTGAATIASVGAGRRLSIAGSGIQLIGTNFYSGTYIKALSYAPITAGNPQVTVSTDFTLTLGSNASRAGFLFAFLLLNDSNGNPFVSIGIDGIGALFGQNFDNPNEVVVAPAYAGNISTNVRFDLDFTRRQATFRMDSVPFGTIAFNPDTNSTIGSVSLVLQSSDPIDSTLRADNLSVTAVVPEPSCSILLLMGIAFGFRFHSPRAQKHNA